jgi:hypothetical protein
MEKNVFSAIWLDLVLAGLTGFDWPNPGGMGQWSG